MKPETNLADLFDELQPEEAQEIRKVDVAKTPVLEAIVKGFEKVIEKYDRHQDEETDLSISDLSTLYAKCFKAVPTRFWRGAYTPKEIEQFSLLLVNYQDVNNFQQLAGLYLSALINRSRAKQLTIYTKQLTKPIDDLGYLNRGKQITVKGDVGISLGILMKRGEIHVYGDAGPLAGMLLEGGKIYIHGDAYSEVGAVMRNGEIHIDGDIIRPNPDSDLINKMISKGKVYHKGKLIVDK